MSEHSPANDPKTEQLVAYLDGELDAESSRRIEELLASDPQVRQQLQRLAQSWELLDRLPRAEVEPSFTQTTVEMIALAEDAQQKKELETLPKRRLGAAMAWASAAMATALIGFWLARIVWPSPNELLLRDLAVIEHLDLYQQTRDIHFLKQASAENLFAADHSPHRLPGMAPLLTPTDSTANKVPPALPVEESIEVRRQRVAAMTPEEKEQLLHKERRFLEMTPADRQKLRDLHAALQSDPQAGELWLVMLRYHDWLGDLSTPQRSELLRLEDDARVTRIRQLQKEQTALLARQLSPGDMDVVVRWTEQRILSKMDPAARKNLDQFSELERRRRVIYFTMQRWKEIGAVNLQPISPDEVKKLLDMLSPPAKQLLQQALDQPQKLQLQQLLATWTRKSLSQFLNAQIGPRLQAEATDERLKKFFKDELTESERQRLLSLPAGEMQRELRRAYLIKHMPEGRPFRQPQPSPQMRPKKQ